MSQPLTYQNFLLYNLWGFRFPTSDEENAFRLMLEKGAESGYYRKKMVNPSENLELYFITGDLVPIKGKKKGIFQFSLKDTRDDSLVLLTITVINNDGVLLEDTWKEIRSFINDIVSLYYILDSSMLHIGYLKTGQNSYERLLDGNHRIVSELSHDDIYYESDFQKIYWSAEELVQKRNLMIVRLPEMTMKIQNSMENLTVIDVKTGINLSDFTIRHEISDTFINNLEYYVKNFDRLDHIQNLPRSLKDMMVKGYIPEKRNSVPEYQNAYIYISYNKSFKRLAKSSLRYLEFKEDRKRQRR